MATKPPSKGYSAKAQKKAATKAVKNFVKNSSPAPLYGIQDKDQRSSMVYGKRTLNASNSAPKEMVYGTSTKSGKGTTVYVKKKKK